MFRAFAEKNLVVFDGAMGTTIQRMNLPEDVWMGKQGCSEILNIGAPDAIREVHRGYFAAGAHIVETNTFGGTRLVLGEYGLEDKVRELNTAGVRLAKEAAAEFGENRFVAASVGPGTKLPSLGQISYDDLYTMYTEQMQAVVDAGCDCILIETCQDMLQVRSALNAAFDVVNASGRDVPVIVSVTVEQNGTLLTGADLTSVVAVLSSFPIFALGFNCATGPDMMEEPLKQLASLWTGRIILSPNAGLPENVNGNMVYSMTPEKMKNIMQHLIDTYPVALAGGCCGTTYDHIRELAELAQSRSPRIAENGNCGGIAASMFTATPLAQQPAPAIIGERANANGSKAFRELLLAQDYDGMTGIAKEQEETGAQFIDLCVAYAGQPEGRDMGIMVERLNTSATAPLVIDSTEPEVIEIALKKYSGKPVINSINFEDGGAKLHRVLTMLKKHPAACMALVIDEQGMAMTAERKVAVARRIYDVWTQEYSLPAEDLIFDMLTFTIGSGDESLRYAGMETLNAIRMGKEQMPGVKMVLGVSNVSFGLPAAVRPILNSVFLHEAVQAGLDMAIAHASKVLPLSELADVDVQICLNLIRGEEGALDAFLEHYAGRQMQDTETTENMPNDALLQRKLMKGDKSGLDELLSALMAEGKKPLDIVNSILLPAMQKVGELFGAGKMLLPFVLQSAEVMKRAVGILEPHMEKADGQSKGTIVLATVKGDVHDIGKNLVDIIMSNNGYTVHNLGIKVGVEEMIQKAKEVNANAIGMSGLLVKSTTIMKENIEKIAQEGLNVDILLGGAALTRVYVEDACEPHMPGKVFYCRDAFDGMRALTTGEKVQPPVKSKIVLTLPEEEQDEAPQSTVATVDVPEAPFWGVKTIENVDMAKVFDYLNRKSLFSARWGYRKKDMNPKEYENLMKKVVEPEFKEMKEKVIAGGVVDAKIRYGYFRADRSDNVVNVYSGKGDAMAVLHLPRQVRKEGRCIADYFRLSDGNMPQDVLPVQIVTLGDASVQFIQELFKTDQFKEYFMYHGLFTELTEALAEYTHARIRAELKISGKDEGSLHAVQQNKYRGERYSFGYPACPEMSYNLVLAKLLGAEEIGIRLTDIYEMVPEYTTSAFVVHHPEASYFTL